MIIKINNNINRFIYKCMKYNIELNNIEYSDNYLIVEIDEEDYSKIKRLCYFSNITIERYKGIKNNINILKKNLFDIILFFIFLLSLFIISNIIIQIDINVDNEKLRNKVVELLEQNDIKKFTFKKNISKLNNISDKILDSNRDILDFISIYSVGMKYVVSVEKRINLDIEVENRYCNIVSDKNAVIESINPIKGVSLVSKGSSVKKGDILIGGSITLNDEVKDNVCASGTILANTWYLVSISYPLEQTDYIKSGKNKLQIQIIKSKKSKYDNSSLKYYINTKYFKIYKEYELVENNYYLDYQTAYSNALSKSREELLNKIGKNSTIKNEKVLKEEEKNSTIYLDIFFSVLENIGIKEYYEVGD